MIASIISVGPTVRITSVHRFAASLLPAGSPAPFESARLRLRSDDYRLSGIGFDCDDGVHNDRLAIGRFCNSIHQSLSNEASDLSEPARRNRDRYFRGPADEILTPYIR